MTKPIVTYGCYTFQSCTQQYAKLRPGTVFLELATRIDPPEREWAQSAGVSYINGSGLPGRFSPKTAGETIAHRIIATLR